jgi:hypothetical protein
VAIFENKSAKFGREITYLIQNSGLKEQAKSISNEEITRAWMRHIKNRGKILSFLLLVLKRRGVSNALSSVQRESRT